MEEEKIEMWLLVNRWEIGQTDMYIALHWVFYSRAKNQENLVAPMFLFINNQDEQHRCCNWQMFDVFAWKKKKLYRLIYCQNNFLIS